MKAKKLASKQLDALHKIFDELGGSILTITSIDGKSNLKSSGEGPGFWPFLRAIRSIFSSL